MSSPLAVLFALPEEAKPFQKRALPGVITAVSGVGMRRAEASAATLLQSNPRGLIICGFGGGLTTTLQPGDLLLAETVQDRTQSATYTPDARLMKAMEPIFISGAKLLRGPLATTDRVLVTAVEKRAFIQPAVASAVDMETAGAVRAAEAAGVPWIAVRGITDGFEDDLPLDFNALAGPDGSVERGRVVTTTLTHPWKIPALLRLGSRSALAARNLDAFLAAALQQWPRSAP